MNIQPVEENNRIHIQQNVMKKLSIQIANANRKR